MASAISFGDTNTGFQAGIINGPVHAEIHPVPERPETPPEPSSNVPFSRDPDFVGRDVIFSQIEEKCALPGSRTALIGLGGVGKSLLAVEYAYRVRKRSSQTWVLWVHASNAARFELSFQDIADLLKIPGRQNPKANIFKLVHNRLHDSKKPWLLILDNVDDADFLFDTRYQTRGESNDPRNAVKPLKEYLPRTECGSILITSRNKEAALRLVAQHELVDIQPLVLEDASALFQKKLGICDDSEDVAKLVTSLEFMPLAIVQAAAYIRQREPRCSVSEYFHKLQQSDYVVAKILNDRPEDFRRDWEAKNSILLTLHISFDYLRTTRRSAADLLSLMSFFDRQGISEDLLQHRTNNTEDHEGAGEGTDTFEEDLLALRNFSFISITGDPSVFEMHRLVQVATRMWLGTKRELERWKGQFIWNLEEKIPEVKYENWMRCQALLPHARSAVLQRPEEPEILKRWAVIMHKVAQYMMNRGSANEAEEPAIASVKVLLELYGEEHSATSASLNNLASIYWQLGRWKEAEEIQVRVMEPRIRMLGEEHPYTIIGMNNLVSIYTKQGRWKEAEEIQVRVMEASIKVLGDEDPATLASMSILSSIYTQLGKWKEAEEVQMRAMETSIGVLGEEHPDTLISMGNLTGIYTQMGKWKEAQEIQGRVVEASIKVLGEEHPDTLVSMGNLVSMYTQLGKWKEVEEIQVRVMEANIRVLGQEHPDTLASMGNLAWIYTQLGKWKEVEDIQVRVMDTSIKVLGEEHPATLTAIKNLALNLVKNRRYKEAENLLTQVLETSKRILGEEHPGTLSSMHDLAGTWYRQGRTEKAIQRMDDCFRLRKKVLGEEHPDTLSSMEFLAFFWKEEGRTEEAIRLMTDCVRLSTKVLGADHPSTLVVTKDLNDWTA